MEYRAFGRTGVRVSPLCLGCMMFGRRTEAEEAYTIIDRALDAGLNFVDTANVYARGKSEEITGQALHRDNRRQRVVLATKVHGVMADDDPNAAGNSRRHIIDAVRGESEAAPDRLHRPVPDSSARDRHGRSTKRCARSTTWSGPARCATSARRPSAHGRSSRRYGWPKSLASTGSLPSSRRTTSWIVASSGSWYQWRKRSASG